MIRIGQNSLDINQLMPLLVFGGLSTTNITLLVVFYPLLVWLYEKIKAYFVRNKQVQLEICDIDNNGNEISTYFDVIWYLEQNNLLKYPYLQYNDAYQRNKDNDYKINYHDEIIFEHNTNNIKIKFNKGNRRICGNAELPAVIICIYANSIDIINKFINNCKTKHRKYLQSKRNSINVWIYEEKWTSSKLKVIKTFDNLFLHEDVRNKIQNDINNYLQYKQLYKQMGIAYKRGFMFYGQPGCGKTSSINAIARTINYDIYKLKLSNFSENKKLFKAISLIPKKSVLVIEDIDRFSISNKVYKLKNQLGESEVNELFDNVTTRQGLNRLLQKVRPEVNGFISLSFAEFEIINYIIDCIDHGRCCVLEFFSITTSNYTQSQLITQVNKLLEKGTEYPDILIKYELANLYDITVEESKLNVADIMEIFDGNEYLHKCLIIITTNYPGKLDRALIRPGRIDSHIKFMPANQQIIVNILASFYGKTKKQVMKDLADCSNITIEQSNIINSIVLPNIENYDQAVKLIKEYNY